MAEHIVHTFPGQAAADLTAGYLAGFDSNGKIALSGAGAAGHGVVSRSVSSGEASGIKYGIVNVIGGAAISAGAEFGSTAAGKATPALAGYIRRGLALTACSGDNGSFLAVVYGPAGTKEVDTFAAVAADGAITIPTTNKTFYFTKAGAVAATIADPTSGTHDGLILRFVATTAQANTLSNAAGSGFNAGGAAKDVGTFGGAIGDNIVITAYGGKWHVLSSLNVTLG